MHINFRYFLEKNCNHDFFSSLDNYVDYDDDDDDDEDTAFAHHIKCH